MHSVELTFDADTDAAIRRSWDDLMQIGVRSQAAHRGASNKPHVTLVVAEQMNDAVNLALRPVLERLPLACTVGAPMLFGVRVYTLVRALVPSAELLALHAHVDEVCAPHMNGIAPHAFPGDWTPHVTLARRVAPDQLPNALALASVGRELRGHAVGLRHWDGDDKVEYPIS